LRRSKKLVYPGNGDVRVQETSGQFFLGFSDYPVNEQNAFRVIRFMLDGALLAIAATNAVVKKYEPPKAQGHFPSCAPDKPRNLH
jgi:hypothetical protein